MSDTEVLLATLVGEDEWSRHQVLDRLRREGVGPEQIRSLSVALGDEQDAGRRAAARMALSALASPGSPAGDEARAALQEAARSDDADLRVMAASALGEAHDPAAVPDLVGLLEDPEPNVAAAAADALGELGAVGGLDALARLTATQDLWLRTAAVVALGRLEDTRAVPALARVARDGGLERPLTEALGRINDEAVLPVLEIVYRTAPLEALLVAGGVLCAHPDLDPPAWVVDGAREDQHELQLRLIEEDDPATARLLGIAASPAAVGVLLDLIGPPRRSEAALSGLLAVAPGPRRDAILERLEEAEPEEQAHLLSMLPPLETEAEIRPLVPLLGSGDPTVRAAAAEALARAPAERALPLLASQLDRGGVAPEVVRALGNLGANACGALTPLLRDSMAAVRAAAAEALVRCGGDSVVADLRAALDREQDREVRRALLLALGQSGRADTLDVLVPSLEDPDPEIRLAAIEALGATGSARALAPLRRPLEGSAWERMVALRSVGDLGRAGVLDVVPVLEPFLAVDDPEVRRAAARAAVGVADALTGAGVDSIVADADVGTRICAPRILGRRGEAGRAKLAAMAASDPSPDVRAEARRQLQRKD